MQLALVAERIMIDMKACRVTCRKDAKVTIKNPNAHLQETKPLLMVPSALLCAIFIRIKPTCNKNADKVSVNIIKKIKTPIIIK